MRYSKVSTSEHPDKKRLHRDKPMKKKRENFLALAEKSPDYIGIATLEGKIVYVNAASRELLEPDNAEHAKSTSIFDYFAKEDLEKLKETVLPEVIQKGKWNGEVRLRHFKSGKLIQVELNAFVIRDPVTGQPLALATVSRDITEHKRVEEELRESEARYRELADSIADVFFAMDKELRYTYWNKASENLTGVSAKDAIGKSLLEIFPDTPQTRKAEKAYLDVLRTQQSQTFINEYQLGGKDFFFEISAYPSNRGLSVFVKDVTERKQAEETIQRYVKRLEVISDVHHAILNANSAEEIVTCSLRHVPKLFPCVRASVATFDFQAGKASLLGVYASCKTKLGPATEFPLSFFRIAETLQHGKINQIEDVQALTRRSPIHQTLLDEGVRSWVNIPLIARGDLVGSLNLGSNNLGPFSPERLEPILEIANPMAVAIQQALQLSSLTNHREQLRFLTKRLLEAEESGQRLLARELHDQVGQSLTALGLNLNTLANHLSPNGKALLNDSLCLLEATTKQIREVIFELRPPALDEYGLAAALRFWAERFSKRTGVPVVDNIQLAGPLSPTVENAFFRIAQEALINIAKHAGANQAILVLEERERLVRLTISDDGKGFDPAGIPQQQGETGYGLLSMRERAIAVGARLHVEAQPGRGTAIVVELTRD